MDVADWRLYCALGSKSARADKRRCKQVKRRNFYLSPGIWQVKELGADLSELGELYGIEPPNDEGLVKSVKEDVEKLKSSPFINPSIDLYGFVYDTLSGKLDEIVSYTPQS